MKTIRVAAALLFDDHKNFLIAKRAYGQFAGKWEFPGGKIEEGETEEDAIIREMKEELDVDVVPEKVVGVFSHAHDERIIELVLVRCSLATPSQKIVSDGSHAEHAWVQLPDCENFDFAPLDREIVDFLKQAEHDTLIKRC
ncbi:MAG: (deoxy)nucleoside triphosphate pyrophosphohydrolase [Candidatus Paceibacterota bacterium]|jgi:8-oxo-dGTP diphosphatase